MRALLLIILLPFILIVAIPVGGILIGVGAGIFGAIIGVFAAIFGVITAIFAAIFGGIFSLGGIATGLIFSKVLLVIFIVLVISALFNRNSSGKKVTKQ